MLRQLFARCNGRDQLSVDVAFTATHRHEWRDERRQLAGGQQERGIPGMTAFFLSDAERFVEQHAAGLERANQLRYERAIQVIEHENGSVPLDAKIHAVLLEIEDACRDGASKRAALTIER